MNTASNPLLDINAAAASVCDECRRSTSGRCFAHPRSWIFPQPISVLEGPEIFISDEAEAWFKAHPNWLRDELGEGPAAWEIE